MTPASAWEGIHIGGSATARKTGVSHKSFQNNTAGRSYLLCILFIVHFFNMISIAALITRGVFIIAAFPVNF